MAVTAATEGPEQLVERVQDLQSRLAAAGDVATQQLAEELVSAIVQMYGAGLERILDVLFAAGEEGAHLAMAMADDPLVATLFMIHDLHPVPLADRVDRALEHVRPYMESHGGNVELLSLEDGVARLRLEGSCSDCSASAVTLELAIKQALEQAAPDLDGLEVEGVMEERPNGGEMHPPEPAGTASAWVDMEQLDMLPTGQLVAAQVGGAELVVANVEGTLLAYRDSCAGCGGVLHSGALVEGALHCPNCSRSFFLPRAGRSMDEDRLQLEPVPLLREHGTVKVAVAP
jgi:Fe-S cluster biogenesis protein NfuA/nitrite reductase/ring-hydroxylating ferredoxin subunit